jgi:GGDEF domain-containing protein
MAPEDPPDDAAPPRWLDLTLAPSRVVAATALLLVAISLGDLVTGPYVVLGILYVVPVAFAAWFLGRRAGITVATVAAVLALAAMVEDPAGLPPGAYGSNVVLGFLALAAMAALVAQVRSTMLRLRDLSGHDPLTKLSNRRRFAESAAVELERAARRNEPIAVIYLDLDDLKVRNDTGGHEAGDDLLVEFADIARDIFRTTDLVARLGGDEFCAQLADHRQRRCRGRDDTGRARAGRAPAPGRPSVVRGQARRQGPVAVGLVVMADASAPRRDQGSRISRPCAISA